MYRIDKMILLALICFLIYACVPVLKETKGDKALNAADKTADSIDSGQSQESPTESKSSVEKDKPSDTSKKAISGDWHARRPSSVEKDKAASSTKDENKTSNKNHRQGTIVSSSKVEKTFSEEEKVKKAALETLKGLSAPIKYTICYDEENDEWWLTVYDDIGHALDVKQYFWTSSQEKWEPFLVLNRIPKGRLNAELSKKSDKKKCSIYEPGSSGP